MLKGYIRINPQANPDAQLIGEIADITPEMEALAGGPGTNRGTGGMYTQNTSGKIAVNSQDYPWSLPQGFGMG